MPEPIQPEPTQPEPTQPEPTQPEPTQPEALASPATPPLTGPMPTGPAYPGPPPPGYALPPAGYAYPPLWPGYVDPSAKSRQTAGLLGIFLGGVGVHRFYLGYTSIGVLQILVTVATCGIGGFWGTIEGILILSGKGITTDADGRPLKP